MKGHFYITPTSSSPVFVTEHGCWLSETCFPNLKWCIFISKLLRDHCEQQCSPTYLIIISELRFLQRALMQNLTPSECPRLILTHM